ncbi:NrsF family protein [Sphingomonas morindae]|uniref:DUF1109 domain-containing protein n=1 Tax=Sphingomonas morindae TaxID=1541170 RepID=A0ABY4XDQ8_9SPHN|nr:NrsF family protein [Sphingomonas morindae]USI75053.1 DUF1109 domain-containing protein [Sphingomonas morindae]
MTSTDALIRTLSADLVAVRRRSVPREVAALAAVGVVEAGLLLAAGAMRPDMAQMISTPFMLWKIGSLALLAGVTGLVAVRSLAPPATPRRGMMAALALAALTVVAGLFVTPTGAGGLPLLQRLSPVHGLLCATAITVLSLPMMAALAVLMRRAAPVRPRQSALACGLAAAASGALIFTICCPMNDPLYVIVWYALGVAAVASAARWLLPKRFRL